jgi:hypothetical protein
MRYLDYIFAWTIFLLAVSFMLTIEIRRLPGPVLDIPWLWLLVAMINFLRLRNEGMRVHGLKVTSVGANLVASMLEIARWRLFGFSGLGGAFTRIAMVAFLGETILSLVRRNESDLPARL